MYCIILFHGYALERFLSVNSFYEISTSDVMKRIVLIVRQLYSRRWSMDKKKREKVNSNDKCQVCAVFEVVVPERRVVI